MNEVSVPSHDGPRVALTPSQRRYILWLLGALSVLTPFSIDMCLPAFTQMARDFHSSGATVSLSVSLYFIGMASGQIIFGPIIDRFGRKVPLTFGLCTFIVMAVAITLSRNIDTVITLRFIQGFIGCVAMVSAIAMVRDFYPAQESARVFSLLFLFIGVSPLLAPSIGALLILYVGWKSIFLLLAGIATGIALLIIFFLPEGHPPDPTISLRPKPILTEFLIILEQPQFITYTLAGGLSFSGLFGFIVGSPIIFMEGFHLNAQAYGGVFALLVFGFISASQVNILLLRKFTSEAIFACALTAQAVVSVLFALGTYAHWYNLPATLAFFFAILACAGLSNPNASALALMPFRKNVGSASALLGFLQQGVGAIIATSIGLLHIHSSFPIIAILACSSIIGFVALMIGRQKIAAHRAPPEGE